MPCMLVLSACSRPCLASSLSSLSKPKEYLGVMPAFLILQEGFLHCRHTMRSTHTQSMYACQRKFSGEGTAKPSQNKSANALNIAKTSSKPAVPEQPLFNLSDPHRRSSASYPGCMHGAAA